MPLERYCGVHKAQIEVHGIQVGVRKPKLRYPDFWTIPEAKREGLERHEMCIAEAQCFRARKFAKLSGAFGKGKNIP